MFLLKGRSDKVDLEIDPLTQVVSYFEIEDE